MSLIVVDIEADGPIPGDYSMIELGAVVVDEKLDKSFSIYLKPISDRWVPEALAVSGHTREQTLSFEDPARAMTAFEAWVISSSVGRPVFASDNNGFDWSFVNWYFWHFLGGNPFGFSSRRLSDLICGLEKDMRCKWKRFRKTPHTHRAIDDARGNAEAFLHFVQKHGLRT